MELFSHTKIEFFKLKPNPVRLEVYYEVLCPDSRYFFLYQLYPAWQLLGDIMEVHLKPFGKASVSSYMMK